MRLISNYLISNQIKIFDLFVQHSVVVDIYLLKTIIKVIYEFNINLIWNVFNKFKMKDYNHLMNDEVEIF